MFHDGEVFAVCPGSESEVIQRATADAQIDPAALGFGRDDRPSMIRHVLDTGVAVVRISGVLQRRLSYYSPSYPAMIADLDFLETNAAVTSVLFDVDCRGGACMGSNRLMQRIADFSKPTVAFASGWMASMALQMACWCDQIVASPDSEIGAVGVRYSVYDESRALQMAGVDQYHFVTGPFKPIGLAPMTPEHQQFYQEWIERLQLSFVAALQNRGLSPEMVAAVSAGQWWGPLDAVALGLADSVSYLGDVVAAMGANPAARIPTLVS